MPNINNLKYSTNGILWTSASVITTTGDLLSFENGLIESNINFIDSTNYIIAAVSKNGTILKSEQYKDQLGVFYPSYNKPSEIWTTATSNFASFMFSSAYGNGLWISGTYGSFSSSTTTVTSIGGSFSSGVSSGVSYIGS